MIKKLIILLFPIILFAQPQLHTQSMIPGPLLNGPGAIFYLEDTSSGTDSISWGAPFSLSSSVNYKWPISPGFDNQPFCTSSTNQTSWCGNIVIPSGGQYKGLDSAGTEIGLLSLNPGDFIQFGSIIDTAGSGDILFYHEGTVWGKLLIDSDSLDLSLEPDTNKVGRIGTSSMLWEFIQGDVIRAGSGRANAQDTGQVIIYSGISPFTTGTALTGTLAGVPGIESISINGNFVPAVDDSVELGDVLGTLRRFKSLTLGNGDLGIGITGAAQGKFHLTYTDGSVIFSHDDLSHSSKYVIEEDTTTAYQLIMQKTRLGGSLNDNDLIGRLGFNGDNSAGNEIDFAAILAQALDVSAFSEDGQIEVFARVAGVITNVADFGLINRFTHIEPFINNTYSWGTTSLRPAKIWTVDLDISGSCTGCGSGVWVDDGTVVTTQNRRNIEIEQAANTTLDLDFVAGDDVDDLVRLRFMNNSKNDGWQLLFDQGTASDVFRIQDLSGNTAIVIDQTNLDTSFQTLTNFTNSVSLIAGDDVDDLVRIRFLNNSGTDGWNLLWDQTGTADEFKVQAHDGTDYLILSQDIAAFSLLGVVNQQHNVSFLSGDAVDDDVKVAWLASDNSAGYAWRWDQSEDIFIIEDEIGTRLFSFIENSAKYIREDNTNSAFSLFFQKTRLGGSLNDNDLIGRVVFSGDNSNGDETELALMLGQVLDVSQFTEDAHIEFFAKVAGIIENVSDIGDISRFRTLEPMLDSTYDFGDDLIRWSTGYFDIINVGSCIGCDSSVWTDNGTTITTINRRNVQLEQVANSTIDLELIAGDDVDDLIRIRLLNQSENDGWNIVFDQTGTADEFKVQDESGVDYLILSQDVAAFSLLGVANQQHNVSFLAGDAVDDNIKVAWLASNNSAGYAWLFDQSADNFILEDESGIDLVIFNAKGIGIGSPSVSPSTLISVTGNNAGAAGFSEDISIIQEGTGVNDTPQLIFQAFNTVNSFGVIRGTTARGTQASPTATQLNDRGLFIGAHGFTGTNYGVASMAAMIFVADETISATNQGFRIEWATTSLGATSRTEKMRLTADGTLLIGLTSVDSTMTLKTFGGNLDFKQDPNITLDLNLVAGDDINDLVRLRFLNASRNDGWNIIFDQTGTADEFKVQDESGVDYLILSQDIGAFSLLGVANQTHFISFLSGDTIDDDVRISLKDTGDTGYEILWDQSASTLDIRDNTENEGIILGISGNGTLLPLKDNAEFGNDSFRWDIWAESIEADGTFTGTMQFGINIRPTGAFSIGIPGDVWTKGWFTDIDTVGLDFSGTIIGNGNVGMNWVPDGDGTRNSATSANSWNAVFTEGLNVQEADDTTLIELSNTTASATQYRLNDPGGTRRMNIGFFGAGDNDVAVSLLGPSASDNIAITTADAFGSPALQIGNISVVKAQCSALSVDASDLATAITLINDIKDCINENNHGLANGT